MSKDTGVNIPVTWPDREVAETRVWVMQTKLHRWAAADPGRRFVDLYNLVHDPATLRAAFDRVAANAGSRTAGVDGRTVAAIVASVGIDAFLEDIRVQLKERVFSPVPVRERMIPKASGKLRRLGIPTVTDRVVQAALKSVLEPIFETSFETVSYGFRPNRRAHDAIGDIHHYGSKGYQWVLDADIEACFDRIDHTALMDRVRLRIGDKRVLALVKRFLKAGIMTETGQWEGTKTGTPQGGILSPLLANIALSVLDEHFCDQWRSWSAGHRKARRRTGQGTWRIVRYADDFVIMVNGTRENAEALRDEAAAILAPLGLNLSPTKTQIVHLRDGFNFLGFKIIRKRKRGTNREHVYTFIADQPVRDLKRRLRSLTRRLSNADQATTLLRINRILRGWATYFQHAVAKRIFSKLSFFVWRRIQSWIMRRHRLTRSAFRRRFHTQQGWNTITVDGTKLLDIATVPVTRYRWRGTRIPKPWPTPITEPRVMTSRRAGCGESRTSGSESGLRKRTRGNPETAPQADSTTSWTGSRAGKRICRT